MLQNINNPAAQQDNQSGAPQPVVFLMEKWACKMRNTIAVFPEIVNNVGRYVGYTEDQGLVSMVPKYARKLKKATPAESASLSQSLIKIGFNLEVRNEIV